MNFCEAMDLLKSGKRMTRTVWKGSMYFLMQEKDVMSYQPKFLDYIYDESIMVSDGWMVVGDIQEYTFCEIIPFLNDGKKAHMKDWSDSYIFFERASGKIIFFMMDRFPFMPGFDSFMATDWVEDDI